MSIVDDFSEIAQRLNEIESKPVQHLTALKYIDFDLEADARDYQHAKGRMFVPPLT